MLSATVIYINIAVQALERFIMHDENTFCMLDILTSGYQLANAEDW